MVFKITGFVNRRSKWKPATAGGHATLVLIDDDLIVLKGIAFYQVISDLKMEGFVIGLVKGRAKTGCLRR